MTVDEQKRLQEQFYTSIRDNAVNLSAWEEEFMDSIEGRVKSNWLLTIEQFKTLERIYTDRTP